MDHFGSNVNTGQVDSTDRAQCGGRCTVLCCTVLCCAVLYCAEITQLCGMLLIASTPPSNRIQYIQVTYHISIQICTDVPCLPDSPDRSDLARGASG